MIESLSWDNGPEWNELEGWLIKDAGRIDLYPYAVVQIVRDPYVESIYFEVLAHWADNEESAIRYLDDRNPREPFVFKKDLSDLIPIRKIF